MLSVVSGLRMWDHGSKVVQMLEKHYLWVVKGLEDDRVLHESENI